MYGPLSSSPSVSLEKFSFTPSEVQASSPKTSYVSKRKNSEESDSVSTYTIGPFCTEVFLGGSCNPTQWRRDEAIPALKEAQITFYNPQREDWLPNLINLEQQAKDNAKVLLFVHDKETRSLASMVEVGERSALNTQTLVLAIEELGDQVMGEKFSDRELKEMRRGRNYMRDIAEVCGIRVFTQIRDAVGCCIEIAKGNCSKEDQRVIPRVDPLVGAEYIKVKSAHDNYSTNNRLSNDERALAFRSLHNKPLPKEIRMDDKPYITDTEFLMIHSEYRFMTKPSVYQSFWHFLAQTEKLNLPQKEVFICGPVGDFDWKTEIARPYFTKHHIRTRERSDPEAEHLMPMEMAQIEASSVLLFVFPNDTWGAAEMVMASYYIARGKKVVLCTQQLCENTLVHGEPLTAYQAKDYNRCRMYLTDQAARNKVPILDSIADAVAKAAKYSE